MRNKLKSGNLLWTSKDDILFFFFFFLWRLQRKLISALKDHNDCFRHKMNQVSCWIMWVVFPLFPSVIIHSLQLWHANSNILPFLFGFKKKGLYLFAGFNFKKGEKNWKPIKDQAFETAAIGEWTITHVLAQVYI